MPSARGSRSVPSHTKHVSERRHRQFTLRTARWRHNPGGGLLARVKGNSRETKLCGCHKDHRIVEAIQKPFHASERCCPLVVVGTGTLPLITPQSAVEPPTCRRRFWREFGVSPAHPAMQPRPRRQCPPPGPPPPAAAAAPGPSHSPGFKRFRRCFIDEGAAVAAGGRRHLSQPLPVSPAAAAHALVLLLLASGKLMISPWISWWTPRERRPQRPARRKQESRVNIDCDWLMKL